MADIDENAAIVNALQRHSTVVVQKSIQEGFGLTVAEAMWKSRPVVASAVGGIKDQIDRRRDRRAAGRPARPRDVRELVSDLLRRRGAAERLGRNAREHVRRNFLANRHARQYIELLGAVLAERADGRAPGTSAAATPAAG